MHNKFRAISLSYKNAPLDIRELVSLDEVSCKVLLSSFSESTNITEALVVSTCNRTEIYYASTNDLSDEIIQLIGLQRDIDDIDNYKQYFVSYNGMDAAVQHLFDVAIGLEAQVVGDLQIINQVKNAYQWSADLDFAGPFLHRLLHAIFYTNKKVVQETAFRDGAASVSYATVDLVNELTSTLEEPKILVVGLGEIGEDVCRNLENIANKHVYISNRTLETAETIAAECGFDVLPFEDFPEYLNTADVIISAVGLAEPIIKKSMFQEGVASHKYLFDLSVPRSIETEIEDIPGLLLYNIDNIESKASRALEKRMAAIPDVKAIINEAISDFKNWSKEMAVSPVINKLKNALEEIRVNEMSKFYKELSEKEVAVLDKVTKSMMQKIIKLPVLQLKAACQRGEADSLIGVLNDLFNLEAHSDEEKQKV